MRAEHHRAAHETDYTCTLDRGRRVTAAAGLRGAQGERAFMLACKAEQGRRALTSQTSCLLPS